MTYKIYYDVKSYIFNFTLETISGQFLRPTMGRARIMIVHLFCREV